MSGRSRIIPTPVTTLANVAYSCSTFTHPRGCTYGAERLLHPEWEGKPTSIPPPVDSLFLLMLQRPLTILRFPDEGWDTDNHGRHALALFLP